MSEEMMQTTHVENPAWFDGKKINGNENSRLFERRTKPFHGIMLL